MTLAGRILLPLLILGAAGTVVWWLVKTKPEPMQHEVAAPVTRVEATRLRPETFPVYLETRGVVRPRTETTLIPEVSGRVIEVSPSFRQGGFFEEGEILLKIDPVDYEAAVVIAESNVAQARTALEEERARGEQAMENWKRLGKSGEPSDLVLRKPQFAEMEARLKASDAELARARRDLERTTLKAPYAGRVLEQNVDVGQFVNTGTQLGRVFAIDYVEIRLPLSNRQLAFADLPELYRGNVAKAPEHPLSGEPDVSIRADIGGQPAEWSGNVVRVEGAIDQRTRQLFVVAQVDDPYRHAGDGKPPLKVGLFVDASLRGKTLDDVFVLPRGAVRAGGEVIVITAENRIRRQKVEPVWSDRDHVVIPGEEAGLKAGDIVCLTPLAFPANGAPVLPTIDGEPPSKEFTGPGPGPAAPGIKPKAPTTPSTAPAPAPAGTGS
ncbi:MAG: efflux RND transporter periplasmic adaptor subunit [Verrucomicrobiae bacterium]|nr:efflux RND transporter periplasmic adaptor subunit [Verrucomicrobiae bacterium]